MPRLYERIVMNFIIDANNLAGKLGLLGEADFDRRLIERVREWLGTKEKQVVLVFDSLEIMGDRESFGSLEVIYSPRDGYSRTADERIIGLFREWGQALRAERQGRDAYVSPLIKRLRHNELYFVSDDIDLRQRIDALRQEIDERIILMGTDEFIAIMERRNLMEKSEAEEDDRGLDEALVENINDELLDIWQ